LTDRRARLLDGNRLRLLRETEPPLAETNRARGDQKHLAARTFQVRDRFNKRVHAAKCDLAVVPHQYIGAEFDNYTASLGNDRRAITRYLILICHTLSFLSHALDVNPGPAIEKPFIGFPTTFKYVFWRAQNKRFLSPFGPPRTLAGLWRSPKELNGFSSVYFRAPHLSREGPYEIAQIGRALLAHEIQIRGDDKLDLVGIVHEAIANFDIDQSR
jgi:hypothetical protein